MSIESKTSHYLGIDYGKSKIGLAIADSETNLATAYGTLDNNRELMDKLAEITKKEEIEKVIIGVPGFKNHGSMENHEMYQDFGQMLQNILPEIEIAYTDEMFSTKIAQANLIEKGMKGVKKNDHQEAARIILQGWMEYKN
jgi:putative Holliday junction resolvase